MAPIGFHKKLKQIGQALGKGISWVNTNIAKPLQGVVEVATDVMGGPSIVPKIYNGVTNGIEMLSKKLGYDPDSTIRDSIIEPGKEIFRDTQILPSDRKNKKFLPIAGTGNGRQLKRRINYDSSESSEEEDLYENPFQNSKRLNSVRRTAVEYEFDDDYEY